MITKKVLNKIVVILTLSLFCSALFTGAVSANEDALNIYTASDLKNFSDNVSAGQTFYGKTVYLMNNLDLSGFEILIRLERQIVSLVGILKGMDLRFPI